MEIWQTFPGTVRRQKMLPRCSLPSFEEKIRAHRERGALFLWNDCRRRVKREVRAQCEAQGEEEYRPTVFGTWVRRSEGLSSGGRLMEKGRILEKLPASAVAKINALDTLDILVPRANGGEHKVVLSSGSLNMLRGTSGSSEENDSALFR